MDRRLGGPRTRAMRLVGRPQILALVGLVLAASASPVTAQPTCTGTDYFTGAAKNGDWNDANNWTAGVPGAADDVCLTPAGDPTVAFTGAHTVHRLFIGNTILSAFGSASVTTTLTVTDTMEIAPGAGFAFAANDPSQPLVTVAVGGTLHAAPGSTIFGNGGFNFRPVIPLFNVASGQVDGTLNVPQGITTEVRGKLSLGTGSTASGHGFLWTLGCPTTPAIHSAATSVQCAEQGTLNMAPGTYQVGVDISGTLDLSDSSDTRTVESYSQDAIGTTRLALTGGQTGTTLSEIIATGTAALGGALEVVASGGTAPKNGDMLAVMTAASVTGTFSTLNILHACLGQIYSLVYSPTKVILAVSGDCSTPTPSPTLTAMPTSTPTRTPSPTTAPSDTPTPTVTPPPTLTAIQTPTSTPTSEVPPTQTSTQTPTSTPVVLPSGTATETPTSTPTNTPTATRTATSTATPMSCVGDCNNDGNVTIDELIKMVNVALGGTDSSACPDGIVKTPVTIDEIISAVNNALGGCRR